MARIIKHKEVLRNNRTIKIGFLTHTKEAFLLSFCKWEFLRRNKKYQKDFDKHVRAITITEDNMEEISDYFMEKWGIYAKDYKYSMSVAKAKDLSFKKEDLELIPRFIGLRERVECLTGQWKKNPTMSGGLEPISKEEMAKIEHIELKVNLLTHKNTLLKDFEEIIDWWQSFKKKYGSLKVSSMRIKDWEIYWKIFDLKEKNPKLTYGQLAMKLNGTKGFSRDEEDKIRKAYLKCRELIEGGYRNINL